MRMKLPVLVVLAVATAFLAVAQRSHADAFTYSSERRIVRAGILVSSALDIGNAGPENPDPHVFYVLDSRTDLKPLGMEFVNPLAPPVITADIYQRWRRRVRLGTSDPAFDSSSPVSQVFRIGARVTKNLGAYWEVNLDNLSPDDLREFDVLLLHTHRPNVAFTAEQREKLLRFIDGGGTLWLDNCGGFSFAPDSPFLFDIQYNNGSNRNAQAVIATPNHPLLAYPYVLTPQEIQQFGDKFVNDYWLYDASPANRPVPGGHTLVPVIWNNRGFAPASPTVPHPNWRPYVLAGQVGAGRVVFCSQDSICAINDYVGGVNVGYGGNSGAVSGDVLIGAHPPDLKFGYNVAAWATAHMTGRTNVRRTGGTSERIAARLEPKWQDVAPRAGNRVGGVAFFRHCAYVVDGDLVLHCYKTHPALDLDGNANADDGRPDPPGAGYDEIWRYDLKAISPSATGASAPTVVEFYDPNYGAGGPSLGPAPAVPLASFNQRELVVVTLSDGTVVAVRALPRAANSPSMPLAPETVADWAVQVSGAQDYGIDPASRQPIPAPAWSEGVLFVGVNTASGGKVVAIDPRNGRSAFHPGPDGYSGDLAETAAVPQTGMIGPVHGSPSVGYVRDQANGAVDKMLYVLTGAATGMAPAVRAFWFGSRGETLTLQTGTNNVFRSRADRPWYASLDNIDLRPRVFAKLVVPGGATYSRELRFAGIGSSPGANEFMADWAGGNAVAVTSDQISFPGGPTVAANDPNVTIYADYTLDWPGTLFAAAPKVAARNVYPVPDPGNTGGNTIGGSPALSPQDTVYYVADTTGSAAGGAPGRGVLLAVNEQYPTSRTRVRWAYVMHDGYSLTVNGQEVRIPARLWQTDDTNGLPTGVPIENVQFTGSPAYRNGIVYATATGSVGGSGVSLVLAFRAEPDLRLRLNQRIEPGQTVRVWQVNLLNTQTAASRIELNPQQYTLDRESGMIRITSMAPPGAVGGFVSASTAFVAQIGSGQEVLLAGNQRGQPVGPEGVDNLLWYAVLPQQLPPQLGGLPLAELWSSVSVQGDALWVGFSQGAIASLSANPESSDPAVQSAGSQAKLVRHLRWATVVPGGGRVFEAPAATTNVLVAMSAAGPAAYEDAITLVADNRRLVEVNSAGEAVWSADGTRTYAVAGGDLPIYLTDPNSGDVTPANPQSATGVPVVHRVAFARPTVARRVGLNDMLVVDTGNNRVLQMDRGGNVVWEVNRLQDHLRGWLRRGDPLSLNEPTDCQFWTEFVPDLRAWAGQAAVQLPSVPGYVVHYLIADSGNFRVVEVVDILNYAGSPVQVGGVSMLRQVNFASDTYGRQGQRYRFRTVERIVTLNNRLPAEWRYNPFDPNNPPAQLPDTAVRQLTLSLVSNYRLVGNENVALQAFNTIGDTQQSGGGSVVLLNEGGRPLTIVSNLRIPDPSAPGGGRLQAIVNPTWFSKFDENVGPGGIPIGPGMEMLRYRYLLADANGCYQLVPGIDGNGRAVLNVEWMLSADDYFRMTGKRLVATCIRPLGRESNAAAAGRALSPLRRYLITNKFTGEDNPGVFVGVLGRGTDFHGEVFVIDPSPTPTAFFSFAFPEGSGLTPGYGYRQDYIAALPALNRNPEAFITWRAPVETWDPVTQRFVRSIGDPFRATKTALLEQPMFADRPF